MGREEAVGYACTWKDADEGMDQPEKIWLDKATRMLLEYGPMKATEFVVDPKIDDKTFSTKPPAAPKYTWSRRPGSAHRRPTRAKTNPLPRTRLPPSPPRRHPHLLPRSRVRGHGNVRGLNLGRRLRFGGPG